MPTADCPAISKNYASLRLVLLAALSCAAVLGPHAFAQQEPQAPATGQAQAADATAPEVAVEESADEPSVRVRNRKGQSVLVHIGSDSRLRANEAANAVVSVFGSATAEGQVDDAVVSLFGNTSVTGSAGGTAIAVFGDTYINGPVHEDAVAVFGNLELGPLAVIHGDAISVGGTIIRDPAAVVHGERSEVALPLKLSHFEWLRPWFEHAFLYARPLAIAPGLGWAWTLALGFLALYVLLALMFSRAVEKCVATLETQPGQSVIASVLTVLLTPPLFLLIVITVIGIAIVPMLALALFCAALFGKAVILAALGRRITRLSGVGLMNHIAIATLIGGLLVLAIYCVPVLGFIVQNVIGILGLGTVVYTLILALRARRGGGEPSAGPQPAVAAAAASPGPEAALNAQAAAEAGSHESVSASASEDAAFSAEAAPSAAAPAAAPEPPLAASAPRAGFWIRMAALFIDVVLVAIVISVLRPPHDVMLLALAAYGAVMWKLKSTTVGGIVCGLRIVRLDGRQLSWDTAIVRALGCFLSLALAGLGFFWIAFDKERQAWHDKIAGTVVVRVPSGSLV